MMKIPNLKNKNIELRSKKSQEKFIDQWIALSTNFITVGYGGMFSTLTGVYGGLKANVGAFIVFGICLFFANFIREEALDKLDLLEKEEKDSQKILSRREK